MHGDLVVAAPSGALSIFAGASLTSTARSTSALTRCLFTVRSNSAKNLERVVW